MCVQSQVVDEVDNDTVEFSLLYSGRLLGASRNDTRASLKHSIRREFHPQLARLWRTKPILFDTARLEVAHTRRDIPHLGATPEQREQGFVAGISAIATKWSRGNYRFVPLVEDRWLKCSLDILFYRPEEPGLLIRSGDIDGRLKTLFDALRIPSNLDEIGDNDPKEGEDPFYCLLADDKFITEVKVTTDQLLLLPKEKQADANDAFLVIRVKLTPTDPKRLGWAFN